MDKMLSSLEQVCEGKEQIEMLLVSLEHEINLLNTNYLSVSSEDFKDIIKTAINKIKELISKIQDWFRQVKLKFITWWNKYEKQFKELHEDMLNSSVDNVMLVQKRTLDDLQDKFNLYLNLYKHTNRSIKLDELLIYSNTVPIFSVFSDTNKLNKALAFIAECNKNTWFQELDAATSAREQMDCRHDIFALFSLNTSALAKNAKTVYVETSVLNRGPDKRPTIQMPPVFSLRNNKMQLLNLKFSDKPKGLVKLDIIDMDLNYESGVKIVDPAINKSILGNLLDQLTKNGINTINKYIDDILKSQSAIRTESEKFIKNKPNDISDDEFSTYVSNIASNTSLLISKVQFEACMSLLDNTKLILYALKQIHDDVMSRNFVYENVMKSSAFKQMFGKEAKLQYLGGMSEFPYIYLPDDVWNRVIGEDSDAACLRLRHIDINQYTALTKRGNGFFGTLFKKKKLIDPQVIFYSPLRAADANEYVEAEYGIKLPKNFWYFHELGHSILDQSYYTYNMTGEGDILPGKKTDKNKYRKTNSAYSLSDAEIEANLFACLMTGLNINDYIEKFEASRGGEELKQRYLTMVDKKLNYVKQLIPVRFKIQARTI